MFLEFKDLGIEAEDWLYERYLEIRKLVKASFKTVLDHQTWLD